jgi:hypothetical protein
MPLQTVNLSSASVPGVSAPGFMTWRSGKPATVSIYISTTNTSSAAVSLQWTLDDLNLIGGTSLAAWQGWSSAPGQPTTVFSASTFADAGVEIPFQTPVAAVRMFVSALTSGPIQLRLCQGEGW